MWTNDGSTGKLDKTSNLYRSILFTLKKPLLEKEK